MNQFKLLAEPWWVNLLILVPFIAYGSWRGGLALAWRQLLYAGLFAVGFGFVESSVVVYLRAAMGLLPGYGGTLKDVAQLSSQIYQQSQSVAELPMALLVVEVFREAATMLMLLAVALAAAPRTRERWAVFLWCFAIWDSVYYLGLWATVRWPPSLLSPDVLFLIPLPWLSQVWFPALVSALSMLAVIAGVASRRTAPAPVLRPAAAEKQ